MDDPILILRGALLLVTFWTTLECLSPRPTKMPSSMEGVQIKPLFPTVMLAVLLLLTYLA